MDLRATGLAFLAASLLTACGTGGITREGYATATDLLRSVNAARGAGATCGTTLMAPVAPLALDTRLVRAAQSHSEDMEASGTLSHTGSDGSNPGDRIAMTGYQAATWGENAAAGYGSVASVVAGWLGSEGHCRNIMNASFTELGGARSGNYWTLVLARPHQGK